MPVSLDDIKKQLDRIEGQLADIQKQHKLSSRENIAYLTGYALLQSEMSDVKKTVVDILKVLRPQSQ